MKPQGEPTITTANANQAARTVKLLTADHLFGALEEALLKELLSRMETASLEAGETLFSGGRGADAMYLVVEGRLRDSESGKNRQPGESIGELSLMTGRFHAGEVTALIDCGLVYLSAQAFHELAFQHPRAVSHFIRQIEPRIRRRTLTQVLVDFFGPMDDEIIDELTQAFEWVHIASGETLIRQGDLADAAYLLLHGRLQALLEQNGSTVVRDLASPEIVGELGLLADTRRSATVIAVRDSNLVRLRKTAFEALLARHPHITYRIAKFIAQRQVAADNAKATQAQRSGQIHQATSFAVVFLEEEESQGHWTETFLGALRRHGPCMYLSARRFDEALGIPHASGIPVGDPRDMILSHWLQEQEFNHRYLL